MNTSDPFCDDDTLDDAAASWLCEREEGFTVERARAFAAWRDRDPRHAAAVARVERTLALLGEMPAVRAPLEARFGETAGLGEAPPSTRRAFPAWPLAAAAALLLGLFAWRLVPRPAPAGERYATAATVQRSVALSDGSLVDINSGSDLRVSFTAQERHVALGTGEGYFKVAHDASRPFIVSAGGVSVRAIGTAFSVRVAAESVDVLVVEGRVEVIREGVPPDGSGVVRPSLGASERASVPRDVSAAVPKIEKVDAAAIRTLLAWQDRMTSFTDVPLREVVARFNRRNALQLVIADTELGERKIGGVIALDQVEAFVRLLEQDGDVAVERRGPDEIVLRRAR